MGIKLALEKKNRKKDTRSNNNREREREKRGGGESVYQLSLFIIGGVKTPSIGW